jgi:glyoxylase-like metal-dependent hydrolase (beta-lactamase superfamily II)
VRIHHLDCGSHCPIGGALYDGRSKGPTAHLCTHCLLLELDDCLVLVDTGYGLGDLPGQPRRLALTWPLLLRPQLNEASTAYHQIKALGHDPRDVRHVVLTHLDFDHAGGIEDFPDAAVHVLGAERDAAERQRRGFVARQRYRPLDWDEVRDWRSYTPQGERWFGFEAVRQLDGLPPEILLVPLPGHTLGHAGVAIRTGDGWLFDAGDAYLHAGQLNLARPHMPPGLAIYERIMATDVQAARGNLSRLRALKAAHVHEVTIFSSHDSLELARLQHRALPQDTSARVRLG